MTTLPGSVFHARLHRPVVLRVAAALLVTCGLLPLGAAQAQPRGDGRVWVEERFESWGPFGQVRDWDGARFHSEGRFFPVNAGTWTYWFDLAETGQELRIAANAIPTEAGRLSFRMGDYVVEEPRQDALRTEFQQPLWLRGASAVLKRDALSMLVHGGTLTERKGVFGWGRTALYEPAYGAALFGNWRENGSWKVDWNRQEAAPGYDGGVHVVSAYGGFTPPEGWSWQTQLRASHEDGSGREGTGAVLGGGYTNRGFQASAHARRISPGFRGLGLYTDPHRNEWGGRFEASYRPRPRVLVGTSWDWGRDLEPGYGRVRPEERLASRFFAATSLTGPFAFRGSVAYRNRTTEDPESLLVDQGTVSWEGALSWNTPRSQAELGYTRSLLRDPLAEFGDWHEDRIAFHGQHRFGDRWRAELHGWTVNRRFLDGSWASRERKLEVRGTWEPRSQEIVWLSVGRNHQDAASAGYRRDQWEVGAGFGRMLPWDLIFDVESLFFARAGSFDTDRTRVNFRLTRPFSFGGGGPGFREKLPEFGTISGLVFEDLNGDGLQQPGEEGLPGQSLILSNGRTVRTGGDGRYSVPDAATYYESVTLDVGRLPARFLAPADPTTVYSLRPGDAVVRDFAIRPAASVAGRVVIDRGNRAEGVPDVLLRVVGTHHDVFTDAKGRFHIPGLDPGETTLEVIAWSIPDTAEPQGPMARTYRLRGGRTYHAGVFVLRPKEQPVMQRFRSGEN